MTSVKQDLPIRQGTGLTSVTSAGDEAVPDADPTSTAGLLAERIQAWKHICGNLEDYIGAVEKLHKESAGQYEKVLKTISKPLREGQHFDSQLGGINGFFDNMRANTQALINTNLETEKNLKGSVLPMLERLHKEIKAKAKELAQGAQKGAKEVEKARQNTQKHIELLGQQTASFEATGGKMDATQDPYVVQRGVLHRLNKQVVEENNHRNDLISVQTNFETFEAHVIEVLQQAMEAFNMFAGGQANRVSSLYGDMLGAIQRVPLDMEWKSFNQRFSDILIDRNEPARTVESISFPNQDHQSTHAVIEGSLERKSRNKLSFGTSTGYYVVSPSRFLHEFKDSDNVRKDPVPEMSIYLPDAVIGSPNGDKFTIKGKDRSKSMGSRLAGTSELQFKAHSPADAEKWYYIILDVAGSAHASHAESAASPISPIAASPAGSAKANELASPASPTAALSKSPASNIAGVSPSPSPGPTSPALASPVITSPVTAGTSTAVGFSPDTKGADVAHEAQEAGVTPTAAAAPSTKAAEAGVAPAQTKTLA
ncbi:PH domain protein [Sporothrix brasiliensis 5110]|uniref:PH domain protein n=1 Tax=Sporothrix brasiliensis 5110 TaxID=1398154 RepID=A0A0C2FAV6_9PEZI|nr:PH domain protein [Sporothrix brasiliensis 5110]KIH88193.1 PH domain protein [Sporothrix brasiliensis 5110]